MAVLAGTFNCPGQDNNRYGKNGLAQIAKVQFILRI